jgi:hypothetical protein
VIAHRLGAEVELLSDLLRRATALQQAQDLHLAWSEVRRHGMGRHLLDVRRLPEDADDAVALDERNRADLDARAPAVRSTTTTDASVTFSTPAIFRAKVLASAARLLRRDDRRELTAARVTDETLGRAVHPADHPVGSMT